LKTFSDRSPCTALNQSRPRTVNAKALYLAGVRSEFRLVWRRRHNGAALRVWFNWSISPTAKGLIEAATSAGDIPTAATDILVATSVKPRPAINMIGGDGARLSWLRKGR
jgi:hypothetical protein